MLDMLLHFNEEQRQDGINEVAATVVIPALRTAIWQAADALIARPGFETSPYAREVAAECIIKVVAEFLSVSSFDTEETARPAMLADEFVHWWFKLDDEPEEPVQP